MQWHAILRSLIDTDISEAQRIGAARDARRRLLIKAIRRHQKLLASRRKKPRIAMSLHATAQYRIMQQALAENLPILCFDAEWQFQFPNNITEIGVALYHHGEMTVHNVRVVPGGRKFLGGTTVYMTPSKAQYWLRGLIAQSAVIVGHALQNDRDMLSKKWKFDLPRPHEMPTVDTASWSRVLSHDGNSVNLGRFAARYGIDCRGTHVAGNDARITLELALTLARTPIDETA
jgi:hypothetical protein